MEIERDDLRNRVSSRENPEISNQDSYRRSNQTHRIISLKSEYRSEVAANATPLGFFKAWTLPGVPFFVLAYSCTKGTCYGILFWLAPFLKEKGQEEVKGDVTIISYKKIMLLQFINEREQYASIIAQMNDVGQFIGGFIMGLLCEKFGRK